MNYNEIWKDIKNYEGLYQVSNLGRVKSLDRVLKQKNGIEKRVKGIILKQNCKKTGYLTVVLQKNNKQKTMLVHRLVAEAFIPNEENKPQVNHINEIKTDNRADNLNWMSSKENNNWGTKRERTSKTKINGKKSKKIKQYSLKGKFIQEFPSMREAERQGYDRKGIYNCIKGLQETSKGFIWKI